MRHIYTHAYLAPEFEVVEVAIEAGFGASSNVEDPIVGPEQEW